MAPIGREFQISMLTKKKQSHISHFLKITSRDPKDFCENICGLMRQRLNFLEDLSSSKLFFKLTQHFIKWTVKHAAGGVMAHGCFAALLLQGLDNLPSLIEPWILLSTRKSWRRMSNKTWTKWPNKQMKIFICRIQRLDSYVIAILRKHKHEHKLSYFKNFQCGWLPFLQILQSRVD